MLFAICMKFRRRALSRRTENNGNCTTFDHLTDAVKQTLCLKPFGAQHHRLSYLMRECNNCAAQNFQLLEEFAHGKETSMCSWERYEYVVVGKDADGEDKKKL